MNDKKVLIERSCGFLTTFSYGVPIDEKIKKCGEKINHASSEFRNLLTINLGDPRECYVDILFLTTVMHAIDVLDLINREGLRLIHPGELLDLINQHSPDRLHESIVIPGVNLTGNSEKRIAFALFDHSIFELGVVKTKVKEIPLHWALPCTTI